MMPPPPPYSETDIYSNASARSPAAPRSAQISTQMINVIYTPPETPRESHYNFSGGDDLATSTSAQAYFESRPVANPSANLEVVHVLAYQEHATPENFPYPAWAASHQTTEQDWHTFVNYLIPDYALSVNAQVVDRKLHTEGHDRPTSETGREIEEAQVNQIKSSAEGASRGRGFDETLSTVIEWNDGFFAPAEWPYVSIHHPAPPGFPEAGTLHSTLSMLPTLFPRIDPRSSHTSSKGVLADWAAFSDLLVSTWKQTATAFVLVLSPSMATVSLLAVRSMLIALDYGGVSRPPIKVGRPLSVLAVDMVTTRTGSTMAIGKIMGLDGDEAEAVGTTTEDAGTGPSSDDSASSSDSDSSLGSLPDWDDLRDSQIPVVKQSVSLWRPPVSKAEFKRVKAEIKAAKSASAKGPADAAEKDEVKRLLAQWKEVKKSQKAMRKLARKEKKAQKKNQKKERRARRNAERGKHRRGRRERRRSERECRRGERHPTVETHGPGFGIPGISGVVPGFPRPPPAGPPHHGGPSPRGLHHQGLPHHGPPYHVPPPHQGPIPFGFGPGRAGGPGFLGGMGLFGSPSGRCGSGGRGSWGPTPCDDPNTPYGDEKAKEAREEAETARKEATERAQEAQEHASLERQAALERAQQARDQADASRQSALASAQEARARAQVSRDVALENVQASRDAALANAQQARDRAQVSRDTALRNAQVSRDAALASAQQARDRARLSRDAALANAQASRERGLNQAREAARGYGGWSSFGRAFDARQNAREWVRTARETAMRHAWSTTSGAQAHADAAREHARYTAAAAAGGAERGVMPVPAADEDNAVGGDGVQETGVVHNDRRSRPVEKKYEVIVSLESELEAKMSNLYRLEQTIQTEGVAAAQAGNGDSKTQSSTQQEYERLGTDIDEMSRRIEALRLEADEEFARELAEDEAAATRP
ncbi:hypothetical protein PG997_004174 [Apiospora hydei]|uniref:Uncharacterized protein n=1 Tax=Apiospora hydei TaxID=1337664 RepID=A0ABR1X1B2_9PEZI